MGSLRGASASGYFALPMTSANRSAPAAADWKIAVTDKTKVTRKARRILMPRRSKQTGRRFQLAPRRPYSAQTALSNRLRKPCQLFAVPPAIATINRNEALLALAASHSKPPDTEGKFDLCGRRWLCTVIGQSRT